MIYELTIYNLQITNDMLHERSYANKKIAIMKPIIYNF